MPQVSRPGSSLPLTPSPAIESGRQKRAGMRFAAREGQEIFARSGGPKAMSTPHTATARAVTITAEGAPLAGDLSIPTDARGIVVFAHGSGSSRHSPRNRFVADTLRAGGLATLLMDLLTEDEEAEDVRTLALRFDIGLLARRLVGATDWLAQQPDKSALPIGYFGASTGAGAALVAAAERPDAVAAIVSRGGRPDLAGPSLGAVRAPTLLIVGGADEPV